MAKKKKNRSKKLSKLKIMLAAMGRGDREAYLELNPHGYRKVHKVHNSKKTYSRKSKSSRGLDFFYAIMEKLQLKKPTYHIGRLA